MLSIVFTTHKLLAGVHGENAKILPIQTHNYIPFDEQSPTQVLSQHLAEIQGAYQKWHKGPMESPAPTTLALPSQMDEGLRQELTQMIQGADAPDLRLIHTDSLSQAYIRGLSLEPQNYIVLECLEDYLNLCFSLDQGTNNFHQTFPEIGRDSSNQVLLAELVNRFESIGLLIEDDSRTDLMRQLGLPTNDYAFTLSRSHENVSLEAEATFTKDEYLDLAMRNRHQLNTLLSQGSLKEKDIQKVVILGQYLRNDVFVNYLKDELNLGDLLYSTERTGAWTEYETIINGLFRSGKDFLQKEEAEKLAEEQRQRADEARRRKEAAMRAKITSELKVKQNRDSLLAEIAQNCIDPLKTEEYEANFVSRGAELGIPEMIIKWNISEVLSKVSLEQTQEKLGEGFEDVSELDAFIGELPDDINTLADLDQSDTGEVETIEEVVTEEVEAIEEVVTEEVETVEDIVDEEVETLEDIVDEEVEAIEEVVTEEVEAIEEVVTEEVETIEEVVTEEVETIEEVVTEEVEVIEEIVAEEVETLEEVVAEEVEAIEEVVAEEVETLEEVVAEEVEAVEEVVAEEVEVIEEIVAEEVEAMEEVVAEEVEAEDDTLEITGEESVEEMLEIAEESDEATEEAIEAILAEGKEKLDDILPKIDKTPLSVPKSNGNGAVSEKVLEPTTAVANGVKTITKGVDILEQKNLSLSDIFTIKGNLPDPEFATKRVMMKGDPEPKVVRVLGIKDLNNPSRRADFQILYQKELGYYQDVSQLAEAKEGMYYYREFIERQTLKQYVKKLGLTDKSTVEDLSSQDLKFILQIFKEVEDLPVAHANLSEENILVVSKRKWNLSKNLSIHFVGFTSEEIKKTEMIKQTHKMFARTLGSNFYRDFRKKFQL